jgi:site-specific DNA recombinase
MTMRTGTSKTGRVYRYYSCSVAARMGKIACKGRSIPMDKLDQLVTGHIADRLLVPERIAALLADIVERRAMADSEVQDRIDQLSREATAAEEKLRRLYALVEDGITDLDEVLKARLADIKAGRGAHSTGSRANNPH